MSDDQGSLDIRITRAVMGALRAHDLSGFELWQWLGPVHGERASLEEPGLYPTLYRLEARGLIAGAWTEEGGTRRVYRITGAGLAEAERHGWGMVASRSRRYDGRSDRSETGEPEWTWRSQQEIERELLGEDEPGYPALEAYLAELDAALPLADLHRHDVVAEIGDHLCAAVARHRAEGMEAHKAVELALAGLGPAHELARDIASAQLTRKRLESGLRWGSAVGMLTALYTLAMAVCVAFFATPVVVALTVSLARILSLHLFAPGTPEWGAEQLAVCGWIGAFVGARRSLAHFAVKSYRSDQLARPVWAATGIVLLTPIILLFPFQMDGFAILTLLGIPVAWVLGTRHPSVLYGETITTSGVVLAVLVASLALLAPGARVWAFDPASTPQNGSPFQAGVPVTAVWEGQPDDLIGRMTISLDAAPGWSSPRLELWPAVESGLTVIPDPAATAPAASVQSGDYVDLGSLSHDVPTWWLAVTAEGPDGHRYTVQSSPHIGWRVHGVTNILSWALGRR